MKKSAAFLLSVLIVFFCVACDSRTFSQKSPYTDVSFSEDVTIAVKEGSLGDTGLTLLIQNNTSQELTYDMTYALEKKKKDGWYAEDRERYFIALAASVEPKTMNEFPVVWDAKLSKGQYRIVKPVVTAEGVRSLAAEFTVGKTK